MTSQENVVTCTHGKTAQSAPSIPHDRLWGTTQASSSDTSCSSTDYPPFSCCSRGEPEGLLQSRPMFGIPSQTQSQHHHTVNSRKVELESEKRGTGLPNDVPTSGFVCGHAHPWRQKPARVIGRTLQRSCCMTAWKTNPRWPTST